MNNIANQVLAEIGEQIIIDDADQTEAILAILQKHVVARAEVYQSIEYDLQGQEQIGTLAGQPDLLAKIREDNRNFVEMGVAQLRECARMFQNPAHFLSAWLRATVVMVKVYEDLLKYQHVNEAKQTNNIILP